MSTAIFTPLLGGGYREGFDHSTIVGEVGAGRMITMNLYASTGLFSATGSLLLPQADLSVDISTFAAFFAARRGRKESFLYLPIFDHNRESASEAVGTGTGAQTVFPLDYTYPKAGTFTVTVNGVAKTEGADFDLSDSGGGSFSLGETPFIKFNSAPALGHAIVATYHFYIPVRFQRDDLVSMAEVLAQKTPSEDSTVAIPEVRLVQDYPGSHLVTVPTP